MTFLDTNILVYASDDTDRAKFDALLLAAAEANRCDTILTEDLNDGQVYAGVRAKNPFHP